ncbi:aspartate aminotransferase [Streptomyces sp. MUSC 125]|uniref:histidinol-phosphate transaminase n=1 Tax=Streptomyces sp. MUSC 125 TaxID=1428624 RepID=UPI00057E2913|nr:histidinol-phosphate transaminase [Streptomyces sp. MUSC 125]KIE27956.1 aspartate aminotransferase [Streptomyces sp. MUSC 125]
MTRIDDLPVRSELRGQTPYGAPALEAPISLNVNENPYPLPEPLVRAMTERVREVAGGLNRYPDRDARELRAGLAGYVTRATGHPVGARQVWAANGSNEVLQQLFQAFGGPDRRALGFEPSYTMHALIARNSGTTWVPCMRDERFDIDLRAARDILAEQRPHLVLITSPNNPTGAAIPAEAVLELYDAAQRARPCMVVVDEAYGEFSDRPSLVPLVEGRPHLVVTRTMSKAFGAAGLRVGYLVADPGVVDAVQLVRLPYHLSTVTQALAMVALEHSDTLLGYVERLRYERRRIVVELREIGYDVDESDASFVQFGPFDDTRRAWQALLDHGVLIRDNGVPRRLRASVGTPAENDAFLRAARAVRHEARPAGTSR